MLPQHEIHLLHGRTAIGEVTVRPHRAAYHAVEALNSVPGRGSTNKRPALVAVSVMDTGNAGHVVLQAVYHVDHATVAQFSSPIEPGSKVRTDAFHGLTAVGRRHEHAARVTPASEVDEWQPKVHRVIANLKQFLLGTPHGVSSPYLQQHLTEFAFGFNRSW